jgi:starch-binding outer membrane protein, SusD/RagB family
MKRFKYYTLILMAILVTNSCSEIIDLSPQDSISNDQFWNVANDLTLYANQFYTSFPVNNGYFVSPLWIDINSDDLIPGTYDKRLAGENNLTTNNANWSFTSIRSVNYGLENYGRIVAPFDAIKSGVGELRFFKAYIYFNLVKMYGDVPWLNHTLNINSEELYNSRVKRNVVIDSILTDLDKAIEFLPLKSIALPNRLNKECALLFKSRVALYEGTWEKYHSSDVFKVEGSDYSKYLRISAEASKQLIDLGTIKLYAPKDPNNYFRELFGNYDLTSYPEILLWKKHISALGMALHTQNSLSNHGGDRGLSKSLVESFLCKDGLPISISPLYLGDNNLITIVSGRDPRCSQSFWLPGDIVNNINNVPLYFTLPWIDQTGETRCTTGYQQAKGRTVRIELGANDFETASIVFRYAEALLNYAEAKAELGGVTQQDINISINELRRRVKMPDLNISAIPNDPKWLYPNLSPLLNEIRRERRVELSCEGFRFDDLARWAAINLLVGNRPLGYKFNQADFPKLKIGTSIFVDSNGYLDPYQKSLSKGYQFNINRDYLLPIPQQEITLNKNLTQNPGW